MSTIDHSKRLEAIEKLREQISHAGNADFIDFPSDNPFVSDPRTIKIERLDGDRFTETRPQHLADVPRTNHPGDIDLATYTPGERDQLARVALWMGAFEHDSRFLESVTGAGHHPSSELEVLLRIRLSVFVEQVADVMRTRGKRLAAEAADEAEAF